VANTSTKAKSSMHEKKLSRVRIIMGLGSSGEWWEYYSMIVTDA